MLHFKLCPVSITMASIGLKTGWIKLWCSARAKAGRSIGDCSLPLWHTCEPFSVSKVAHTSLSEGYQCDSLTHWKFSLVLMKRQKKIFYEVRPQWSPVHSMAARDDLNLYSTYCDKWSRIWHNFHACFHKPTFSPTNQQESYRCLRLRSISHLPCKAGLWKNHHIWSIWSYQPMQTMILHQLWSLLLRKFPIDSKIADHYLQRCTWFRERHKCHLRLDEPQTKFEMFTH